jgi:pyrroloquinoline quinone biosynthesis protein E
MTERPYTLVAELSHRCPLACPYCSNPSDFGERPSELSAAVWGRVFSEAAALGIVQVHLTGGEPLVRGDLEEIAHFARAAELYVNLVTSGIPLDEARWRRLAAAGIDHVQLSIQAPREASADRIAGRRAFAEKLAAFRVIQATGTPVTLNVVLHRENVEMIDDILELAERLGVRRVELAHAQYHGFALSNRDALLPSADAIARARARVRRARETFGRRRELVHVLPDYHAGRPKACMDGWGRRYVVVAPDGTVLPCHAARSIAGLEFDNVLERSLSWVWNESSSFNAFRGQGWMKEPCRTCPRRFEDFGGCRCQAFALTGDASATDPACPLAPAHGLVLAARSAAEKRPEPRYLYRSPRSLLANVSPAKFSRR